jgi:hypothetical protein
MDIANSENRTRVWQATGVHSVDLPRPFTIGRTLGGDAPLADAGAHQNPVAPLKKNGIKG